MKSLQSAILKTKRAKVHINALKRATLKPYRYTFVGKHNPNTKDFETDWSIKPKRLPNMAIIAGDIATNLRASLDHIAFALLDPKEPITERRLKSLYFPLIWDVRLAKSRKGATKYMIKGADAIIERFQPYNRTKWSDLEWLDILNEIVNFDKHRRIVTVATAIRFWSPVPAVSWQSGLLDFKKGKVHVVIPYSVVEKLKADGKFDVAYSAEIFFDVTVRGTVRRLSVNFFDGVHRLIAKEMIPAFSSLK